MQNQFVIYGANGYTGALIAREAAARGLRPILAGRNAAALAALAGELGLDYRAVALDDATGLDNLLDGVGAVLHCAGPFVHTSRPMADACLRQRAHYLDITGEIGVYEALAARDGEAQAAGVLLLPGVGFDIVPSDCLAAHLKRRLPTATHLTLGLRALGGVSQGTALTGLEAMARGESGLVRRGGKLTPVPAAWKTRAIDFGRGPRPAVTIPWGDVSAAWYSTGIPNIEVYMAFPESTITAMRLSRYLGWAFKLPGVTELARSRIRAGAPGPDAQARQQGRSLLWGRVEDDAGNVAETRMQTPEGYTLTVLASLLIVDKVLAGAVKPGFQTPSLAFGPDLVLEINGVTRTDVAD
jgi:short subunit dehydrogenase-like uncharacterized protein